MHLPVGYMSLPVQQGQYGRAQRSQGEGSTVLGALGAAAQVQQVKAAPASCYCS